MGTYLARFSICAAVARNVAYHMARFKNLDEGHIPGCLPGSCLSAIDMPFLLGRITEALRSFPGHVCNRILYSHPITHKIGISRKEQHRDLLQ